MMMANLTLLKPKGSGFCQLNYKKCTYTPGRIPTVWQNAPFSSYHCKGNTKMYIYSKGNIRIHVRYIDL
jgi:hypothetical protein